MVQKITIFPYFMLCKCPYLGEWVVLKTPLRNINYKDGHLQITRVIWLKKGFKEPLLVHGAKTA